MTTNPSGGRLATIIAGGAIASLATLVLAGGAALHWVDGRKDADGYFTTTSERFSTNTYALTTENIDLDDGVPGDRYGKIRLKVRSDDGAPVFAGIARTADVDAYLDASARALLTNIDVDPFEASYVTTGGDRKPAPPASQRIWTASAAGAGTQTLTWEVRDGSWSIVVMNADGSAGVDADVSAGANVPIVGDLATGLTVGGLLLLALGGALLAGGLISRQRQPSVPAGSASAT